MDENEIANGFKLAKSWIDDETYLDLVNLWLNGYKTKPFDSPYKLCDGNHCGPCGNIMWPCTFTNYPRKSFEQKCDETMCSIWNNQNAYGESYLGYWSEFGQYEEENASDLTREYNIYRLACLPFPDNVLIETINEYPFDSFAIIESVRYCNYLCEVVRRKYFEINGKHLPVFNGVANPLNEKEFVVKKKYKTISYINKQFLFLTNIPKYIKMEILQDYTELTFWQLYNL
jgi:hypothetical protein